MKVKLLCCSAVAAALAYGARSSETGRAAVPPLPSVRAVPPGTPEKSRLRQGISRAVQDWEREGRAKTLAWYEEHQFGKAPIGRPADEVIGERSVSFAGGRIRIDITVVLPEGASKDRPVPVFLHGDHCCEEKPPYAKCVYPDVPTNSIVARGYAYVTWNFNDVCPNAARFTKDLDRWADGVIAWQATGDPKARNVPRTGSSWGTIGAWAWGHSRVMDWIETRPELDASRVAVLGHSRCGKTALWAAAQDERFAMGISNDSGCGGAKLNRLDLPKSEHIGQILHNFPNWFCTNYTAWIGRDAEIPVDSDSLIKLIAPRLAYVASATGDAWAGPPAEFAAAKKASALWEQYRLPGLGLAEFPGKEAFDHSGRVGYHLRPGEHHLGPYDWNLYMDFADKYLKAPSARDSEEIERRLAAAVADGSRRLVLGANPAAKDGAWRPVRAILLPDDFTLVLDGCRIEQPRGVRDNLIRNEGAAEGNCRENRKIRILGRNGATLSMGSFNQYLPLRSGDPNGWRSVGILLAKVRDYELAGFKMEETQCWAISQEGCSNGYLHDLEFASTDLNYNQDGIDVRKGCHDIRIERISGSTGDDLVALTAYRTAKGAPPLYGMQISGISDCGEADDVYNVTIRGVHGKSAGGHGVIRLLVCDGIRMHHVAIEDVVDTASGNDRRPQATIRLGDVSYHKVRRCQMGEMHHVTVKGVKASGKVAVWMKGPMCDSSVTDVTPGPGGRRYDITAPLERVALDPEVAAK